MENDNELKMYKIFERLKLEYLLVGIINYSIISDDILNIFLGKILNNINELSILYDTLLTFAIIYFIGFLSILFILFLFSLNFYFNKLLSVLLNIIGLGKLFSRFNNSKIITSYYKELNSKDYSYKDNFMKFGESIPYYEDYYILRIIKNSDYKNYYDINKYISNIFISFVILIYILTFEFFESIYIIFVLSYLFQIIFMDYFRNILCQYLHIKMTQEEN